MIPFEMRQARRLALKATTVRVLGIDPGSQRTGFGVVDAAGARA